MKYIFTFVVILLSFQVFSQEETTSAVYGTVTDAKTGEPLEAVSVFIPQTGKGALTDFAGAFILETPSNETFDVQFSYTGYELKSVSNIKLYPGKRRKLNIKMESSVTEIEGAEVTGSSIDDKGTIRENVEPLKKLPNTTGNIEAVLPQIALGTTSGTGGELSSQYSVRGGNYDENLVYVNDFEIYRPQLIRAGQQEGLTFPNIDMIRDLSFSSGGFDARYGDKMSSVLDIKYKRPTDFGGSVGLSFLGGSAHIEGSVKKDSVGFERFRYLVGARYKTTRYLLGSLDIKGEYTPNFADVQGYFTYDINENLQVGLIGNFNRSEYQFQPVESSTTLGLVNFALQFRSFFEGQEVDDFTTYMTGVSLVYLPDRKKNPYYLKLLASTFQSNENERIDIIGDYSLNQIETDLGSNGFGDVVATLGTGTQHQYVRNYLKYNVSNVEHKGGIEFQKEDEIQDKSNSHFIQWGVKYQREDIDDRINEWERLDSAGYSIPYDPNAVLLQTAYKTKNLINSNRFSAYLQDTWTIDNPVGLTKFSLGVRASYWDLNKEAIISPRLQLLYKPKDKNVSYRLAGGMYFQPAFYREMRRLDGSVNTDIKAQKSAHILLGTTFNFDVGKIPFKFIAEAYYKSLWDIVSYDLDNVRIRYSGENDAKGYVMGLDMRVNGEFVPGAESWINFSLLRARENLLDVQHLSVEEGDGDNGTPVDDVPRPTDQLLQLAIFFQDYLPKNENFKMHLNFTVGTGWPFGIPNRNKVYRNTYRFKPYHRVDIGFSAQLYDRNWERNRDNHPLRFSKSTWLSLEVFNLMEVANEASNTWIKTITNTQFAIPNNLTSRRINLRLKFDF